MKLFKSRKSTRQLVAEETADTTKSFSNVKIDILNIYRFFYNLRADFILLRDEIATNGVVRDLRKLQKDNEELKARLDALQSNGVETAINNLNKEVFGERKEDKDDTMSSLFRYYAGFSGDVITEQATLAGKVKAILDYLKLDVQVQPEEVKKAKPVAKKVAAPKKRGRR